MKNFFYSTLITLGLGFAGVSAHAQTASADIFLDNQSEFTVVLNESGNSFSVTVTPDSPTARSSYVDDLDFQLFVNKGGAVVGSVPVNFALVPAPTGGVTAPWVYAFNTPSDLEYYSGDPSGENLLGNDIGQGQIFTGGFSIQPGQSVGSFQVALSNIGLEESAGGFGDFNGLTPEGTSLALIVPGLLPLGVVLRRRRRSKAQA
jgi:hypothetical protein